ncbi:MAG: hypothetical protein EXS15_08715 [Phycisphaerales bacterium]|nr:hypothetical protein [Phycisphaerales bacterium]
MAQRAEQWMIEEIVVEPTLRTKVDVAGVGLIPVLDCWELVVLTRGKFFARARALTDKIEYLVIGEPLPRDRSDAVRDLIEFEFAALAAALGTGRLPEGQAPKAVSDVVNELRFPTDPKCFKFGGGELQIVGWGVGKTNDGKTTSDLMRNDLLHKIACQVAEEHRCVLSSDSIKRRTEEIKEAQRAKDAAIERGGKSEELISSLAAKVEKLNTKMSAIDEYTKKSEARYIGLREDNQGSRSARNWHLGSLPIPYIIVAVVLSWILLFAAVYWYMRPSKAPVQSAQTQTAPAAQIQAKTTPQPPQKELIDKSVTKEKS